MAQVRKHSSHSCSDQMVHYEKAFRWTHVVANGLWYANKLLVMILSWKCYWLKLMLPILVIKREKFIYGSAGFASAFLILKYWQLCCYAPVSEWGDTRQGSVVPSGICHRTGANCKVRWGGQYSRWALLKTMYRSHSNGMLWCWCEATSIMFSKFRTCKNLNVTVVILLWAEWLWNLSWFKSVSVSWLISIRTD